MRLGVSDRSDAKEILSNPAGLSPRLVLGKGDLFRLPAHSPGFEVVAGVAWVTIKDRDIFLAAGERLVLPTRRDPVLISALGRKSLIMEVFGINR